MNTATHDLAGHDDLQNGMNVFARFRDSGFDGLSQCAACFVPLLQALGWSGRPRHIAEAMPHFIDDLDINDFRTGLANLNFKTTAFRTRQDRINPGLFPCLFVPDKGAVRLLLAPHEDGTLIYDGSTRETRVATDRLLYGTTYVVNEENDLTNANQPAQRSWMATIAERFRGLLIQVVFITFLFNFLSLGMPLFMLSIYDTVIPSGSVYQLNYLLIGVLLALGFEYLLRRMRSKVMAFLGGRIDFLVGTAAFQKIMFLPLSMIENESLGAQISHLEEFESIREFFTGSLGESLLDLPFVILFLTVIALLSGWLVLVPIAAAILLVICGFVTSPIMKRAMGEAGPKKTAQNRFLIEAVSGMRSIKLLGAEDVWLDRFKNISASTAINEFKVSMVNHSVQTLSRMVTLGSGIAMVGFGAGLVISGSITIGALVASMALVWRALAPLQSSFITFNRLSQIRSSLQHMDHLMRLPPERPHGNVPVPRRLRGRIEFSNVSHRFNPNAEPALNGVSFEVEPGEVVAITGPNAAGKSTIVNLAAGVYQPQFGSVLIDGINVRQMDTIDVRQQIGLAPQISELIYGTIAQNLRLVVPTATDDELVEVTKMAGIYEDINSLPDKFDTRLTETFQSSLNEAFKQKLSLARAYLRAAPIMIFDECGEVLDEHGDKAFMAAVQRLRGAATILIVTHRPSHMRLADRLIVMRSGKIEMNGPSEEVLLQLSGAQL